MNSVKSVPSDMPVTSTMPLLQRIGELHDQDSVLRYQSDERDQPDLRVDVEGRQIEEAEDQRARNRERHRAEQHDQRIAETPELRRQHEIDQDHGEPEGDGQRSTLTPDLSRFAGIVERQSGRIESLRRALEHA